MHASDLIGAKVSTSSDKNVGPVEDLIIDRNGQIVAVVVSVGGFLGMGQKHVAIGWDHVTALGALDAKKAQEATKSRTADDLELRIDVTREDLRDAPEFKARN